MFKDLTVKAKWLPGLLAEVAKAAGVSDLKASYYPTSTDGGKYMKAQDNKDATLADQEAQVGLGKYAFVVGNEFFPLPKAALIELGKGEDEGKTYTTKEELESKLSTLPTLSNLLETYNTYINNYNVRSRLKCEVGNSIKHNYAVYHGNLCIDRKYKVCGLFFKDKCF